MLTILKRLFRKRATTTRSGEIREQLMRDAEFLAARADLIAATPQHRRGDLFAFLDRVELTGRHPVKLFGDWDDGEPSERYAMAFYGAIRRAAALHDAQRQPDVKVNVAIGESRAIGTGQLIRYRDWIVNDTLLLPERSDGGPPRRRYRLRAAPVDYRGTDCFR